MSYESQIHRQQKAMFMSKNKSLYNFGIVNRAYSSVNGLEFAIVWDHNAYPKIKQHISYEELLICSWDNYRFCSVTPRD